MIPTSAKAILGSRNPQDYTGLDFGDKETSTTSLKSLAESPGYTWSTIQAANWDQMTVAFWFWGDLYPAGNIVHYGSEFNLWYSPLIRVDTSYPGGPRLTWMETNGSASSVTQSNIYIPEQEWVHIAVTKASSLTSATAKIYINGSLSRTTNLGAFNQGYWQNRTFIGSRFDPPNSGSLESDNFLNYAIINDFRQYTYEMNSTEVAQLASGPRMVDNFGNLKNWWKMNEGADGTQSATTIPNSVSGRSAYTLSVIEQNTYTYRYIKYRYEP